MGCFESVEILLVTFLCEVVMLEMVLITLSDVEGLILLLIHSSFMTFLKDEGLTLSPFSSSFLCAALCSKCFGEYSFGGRGVEMHSIDAIDHKLSP